MDTNVVMESARRTIILQAEAIQQLTTLISESMVRAVKAISESKGRVIVSGIGKSAIVAQKITATLNSTGTPALFMHAADAIHGDLGMVQQDDVVIIISKSGDSPEIKVLVPFVKNFGNKLIGIVGNMQSFLAHQADIVLNTTVQQEACPNNLAPTTSTTAQMVMGDALAICLMENIDFTSGDFAKYHPGGSLGKKLYLRVEDMVMPDENPMVKSTASIKEVLVEMTRKRLGASAVLSGEGSILGIITDGDIRRMLEKYDDFSALTAEDIMSANPKTIPAESLAMQAFEQMKAHNISQLIVLKYDKYLGILHLHDLVREGII